MNQGSIPVFGPIVDEIEAQMEGLEVQSSVSSEAPPPALSPGPRNTTHHHPFDFNVGEGSVDEPMEYHCIPGEEFIYQKPHGHRESDEFCYLCEIDPRFMPLSATIIVNELLPQCRGINEEKYLTAIEKLYMDEIYPKAAPEFKKKWPKRVIREHILFEDKRPAMQDMVKDVHKVRMLKLADITMKKILQRKPGEEDYDVNEDKLNVYLKLMSNVNLLEKNSHHHKK